MAFQSLCSLCDTTIGEEAHCVEHPSAPITTLVVNTDDRPARFCCPFCQKSTTFIAFREIMVVQQLFIVDIDTQGNYEVDDDDLLYTVFKGEITELRCEACNTLLPIPNPLQGA
jgi:hypothetical protein